MSQNLCWKWQISQNSLFFWISICGRIRLFLQVFKRQGQFKVAWRETVKVGQIWDVCEHYIRMIYKYNVASSLWLYELILLWRHFQIVPVFFFLLSAAVYLQDIYFCLTHVFSYSKSFILLNHSSFDMWYPLYQFLGVTNHTVFMFQRTLYIQWQKHHSSLSLPLWCYYFYIHRLKLVSLLFLLCFSYSTWK